MRAGPTESAPENAGIFEAPRALHALHGPGRTYFGVYLGDGPASHRSTNPLSVAASS